VEAAFDCSSAFPEREFILAARMSLADRYNCGLLIAWLRGLAAVLILRKKTAVRSPFSAVQVVADSTVLQKQRAGAERGLMVY
jgi:hypothetical protein